MKTASSTVLRAAVWVVVPALLLLGDAGAAPAAAAVLEVDNKVPCSDTGGAPYCTISAAVSRAVPGDTVSIASGNYSGRVWISKVGTASAPVTITTSEGAVLTSTQQGFDFSGASFVTLSGFTVDNTVWEGIRCTLCSNVTIANNTVKNARGSGIYINNSSSTVLTNNKVEYSLLTGIDIAGSNNIQVLGGHVTRSGLQVSGKVRNGIRFSTTTSSLVDGTQVYANSDIGVYIINGSTGIRIKRVVAHHNARAFERIAAGIESRSAGNFFESNISYQNEDSGINMRWGGADGVMVNNVTYLNGDHGIDVLDSPRPIVISNTVYKNTTSGINIEGTSAGGYVYNNISADNALNTTRKKGNINIAVEALTLGADYNLVSACCGSVLYFYQGTFNSLASLKAAYPGVEAHGTQALPGWVSEVTNDFHLSDGSPAIDSAKSDAWAGPETTQDVESQARCDNAGTVNSGGGPIGYMDRGAYEHISSCGGGDSSPPSVPANLAGTAASMTRIDLVWDTSSDDTGVAGYKVFRGGSLIATVTGTSYSNTGLSANTAYNYAVAAFDAAGNTSAASSAISVTTLSDTTPPSVPANLAGTAVSSSQINLAWTAASDDVAVAGYKVYRGGNLIATVTSTSFSNSGLTANTTYNYAVAAFDGAGNLSAQSTPVSVTTPAVSTNFVWERRVTAKSDDAEEAAGGTSTDLSSTDLELAREDTNPHLQIVGLRFTSVTIPKGAIISNAYIQFVTDETSSDAVSLSIAGEAIDSSPTYTTADNNISARAKTVAKVSWSPVAWTVLNEAGTKQRSPNLSSIIQEIVNRSGWTSGGALSIFIDGTGKRVAQAYNLSAANAPLLHIEYSLPGS